MELHGLEGPQRAMAPGILRLQEGPGGTEAHRPTGPQVPLQGPGCPWASRGPTLALLGEGPPGGWAWGPRGSLGIPRVTPKNPF